MSVNPLIEVMEMQVAETISRTFRRVLATVGLSLAITAVASSEAQAHCDTMDGPVVTAARRALETGSANHVLIWVRPQDEPEILSAFQHALAVRRLGAEAQHGPRSRTR